MTRGGGRDARVTSAGVGYRCTVKAYALLWGIGLVMVIVGFAASMGTGFSAAYTVLIVGGFLLGAVGFLVFARRDQGTVA